MDTKSKNILKSKLKIYSALYQKAEKQNDNKRMNLFSPLIDDLVEEIDNQKQ